MARQQVCALCVRARVRARREGKREIDPIANTGPWLYAVHQKQFSWAVEMVQQVKVLATKSPDLSSIPESHVVEEENPLLQVVF